MADFNKRTPIIIAESDAVIQMQLSRVLAQAGYAVAAALDVPAAIASIKQAQDDALLLIDANMGVAVRAAGVEWSMPAIVLSSREQETEKIALLEQGVADYLRKPLAADEDILSRVKMVERSMAQTGDLRQEAYLRNGLKVDLQRRQVALNERRVHLTPTEYDLLEQLILRDGRLVSQARLMREIWGQNGRGRGHYLRIYIQRLRQKLGDDPFQPKYIVTETGIGYRLMESERPAIA